MSVVRCLVILWIPTTAFAYAVKNSEISVRLNIGSIVRGNTMHSEKGRKFYAFRGIPYAEPPVNNLRFKPPVPIRTAPRYLDATKDGPVCVQLRNNKVTGQEDCLYLNVYTPQLLSRLRNPRANLRAVMVFIHGGYFMIYDGTSAMFPPGRLMDSNVVLVTMNYRLNALGFLGTEDSSSPGNYGLLDQVLALKWIKDNIKVFGGNPTSVTIFGQSSGAASASYHILSPLSTGLFHRAILMSGSSLCVWAFESNPLRWAKYLANQTDCPTTSTAKMVDCLRAKPAAELVKPIPIKPIPFPPTLDGYFLRSHPAVLMKTAKNLNSAYIMTGVTRKEGTDEVWALIEPIWNSSAHPNEFVNTVVNYMTSGNQKLSSMIKDRYLATIDLNNKYDVARTLMKTYSDGAFVMPHYLEVSLLSNAGMTVYAYSYDNSAENVYEKVGSTRMSITNEPSHGEDLYMLFNKSWSDGRGKLRLGQKDKEMVTVMTGLWSSFAKTGNPDPTNKYRCEWNPSSTGCVNIHHLNNAITRESHDLAKDELFRFWTENIPKAMAETKPPQHA